MPRHPTTPDCSVDECGRAAYSLGLCRFHRPFVPWRLGYDCAIEAMESSHEIRRKYERKAARLANAAVRGEDAQSSIGTAA